MGAERVLLARLLLWQGERALAADVAAVLDSPAAYIHPLYLRAGLRVRLEAAEALRDVVLASRLRERMRRLELQPSASSP
jgi:hypothetical protein